MQTSEPTQAERALVDYLGFTAPHSPFSEWLLRHGRLWTPALLSAAYGRGPLGECYGNSLTLAARHSELTYVEGQATGAFGMPMMHAWCVTPDGAVVDVTWDKPEERGYQGVAFDTAFARALVVRQKYFGLLANDWMHDNQITGRVPVTDLNEHGIEVIVDAGEA